MTINAALNVLDSVHGLRPTTIIPEFDLENWTFSYSQVSLLLQCPQKWYRRYVLKQAEAYNAALAEGTVVGAACQEAYRQKVQTKAVRSFLRDQMRERWEGEAEKIKVWNGENQRAVALRMTRYAAEFAEVYGQFAPVKRDGKEGLEWHFVEDFGGVTVQGYIDLLEESSVIDFKCVGDPSKEVYDPNRSLQLALYAAVTGSKSAQFVIFQKRSTGIVFRSAKSGLDPARCRRWWAEVARDAYAQVKSWVFPRCNPADFLCSKKWCAYYKDCLGELAP